MSLNIWHRGHKRKHSGSQVTHLHLHHALQRHVCPCVISIYQNVLFYYTWPQHLHLNNILLKMKSRACLWEIVRKEMTHTFFICSVLWLLSLIRELEICVWSSGGTDKFLASIPKIYPQNNIPVTNTGLCFILPVHWLRPECRKRKNTWRPVKYSARKGCTQVGKINFECLILNIVPECKLF